MKNLKILSFFTLISHLFCFAQCKKHKSPGNPVDQLPPETQTGANTFGCLINGQAFLPKGPSLSPILQCAYQYLNTNYSQGYFFQLSGSDRSKSTDITSVGIYTDSLNINENVFQLGDNKPGNAYGFYSRKNLQGVNMALYTTSNLAGQLTVTRFDEINQIVSGTFWFNAVNTNGDTVHVTDGRFDMQFTK